MSVETCKTFISTQANGDLVFCGQPIYGELFDPKDGTKYPVCESCVDAFTTDDGACEGCGAVGVSCEEGGNLAWHFTPEKQSQS